MRMWGTRLLTTCRLGYERIISFPSLSAESNGPKVRLIPRRVWRHTALNRTPPRRPDPARPIRHVRLPPHSGQPFGAECGGTDLEVMAQANPTSSRLSDQPTARSPLPVHSHQPRLTDFGDDRLASGGPDGCHRPRPRDPPLDRPADGVEPVTAAVDSTAHLDKDSQECGAG